MASDINVKGNEEEDSLRIQDFIYLCISHWKWFAISLAVTLGIATLHLLRTPPSYTRTASILVKEEGNGSSFSSEINSFADMGLFSNQTNVNNELISIKSPSVLLEVIKRLNLDMNYTTDGTFHDVTLYGATLPATVYIAGVNDNESASFTMHISPDGNVQLDKFKKSDPEFDESDAAPANGHINDSIPTPVGTVIVRPTPYFSSMPTDGLTINVSRASLLSAIERESARLSAEIADERATIINLTYRDVSIQRAEDFLNMLIAVYNENWIKDKNQIAVSTSRFIDERLGVIEHELGNVDSDISSYKSEHLIPDVEAASAMYMNQANEAASQILELNNQLYMARYIRSFVSNGQNNDQVLPANSGINNPNIEKQISEYNTKLLQRNSLLANSSENNPLVIDLGKSLESIRQAIVTSIDNEINALNTQISSFRSSQQQSNARIASNPTQAKYLLSVERQQKVKESLYLFLLQKREENELSQAFTAYNTRIVTPPMGTMRPTAPVRRNILFIAIVLGLVIPAVILFVRENFDTTIRGRKDIEHLTMPFLGEIPQNGKRRRRTLLPAALRKKQIEADDKEVRSIVVKSHSRNVVNEAFRVVRTNIEFMTEPNGTHKAIMTTSANPGSGKTFITLNIASSFAIKGKKTAIVDLDMRKASLSAVVSSPASGVSGYLSGKTADWHQIVCHVADHDNLDIIPVGTIPPNPSELLYSPRLTTLIEELKKEYDLVFIDCPPVDIVADTSIISKHADMTIFIIRATLLDRDMLPVIEAYYTDGKFNNMAILLNGTDTIKGRYGYHRHGYGYGYGYGNYADEN